MCKGSVEYVVVSVAACVLSPCKEQSSCGIVSSKRAIFSSHSALLTCVVASFSCRFQLFREQTALCRWCDTDLSGSGLCSCDPSSLKGDVREMLKKNSLVVPVSSSYFTSIQSVSSFAGVCRGCSVIVPSNQLPSAAHHTQHAAGGGGTDSVFQIDRPRLCPQASACPWI